MEISADLRRGVSRELLECLESGIAFVSICADFQSTIDDWCVEAVPAGGD